jgi:hypothetical protein
MVCYKKFEMACASRRMQRDTQSNRSTAEFFFIAIDCKIGKNPIFRRKTTKFLGFAKIYANDSRMGLNWLFGCFLALSSALAMCTRGRYCPRAWTGGLSPALGPQRE